jgi:Notch-like protein
VATSTSTTFSGNCDIDVDECDSSPCANLAACTDSHDSADIPVHTYRCACHEGFANGMCDYAQISEYDVQCTVSTGGNCNIDLDECASSPCENGASCTDSADGASIPVHAYSCACGAGYSNGACIYTTIPQYTAACLVATGGNCDVDVDECLSSPCQNGASCTDSSDDPTGIPAWNYKCTCGAGFANGDCGYSDVIAQYVADCGVLLSGNCDIDVDECSSSPCFNGATCDDSTTSGAIVDHSYICACVAGFESTPGNQDCAIDIDECASSPCVNGAACTEAGSGLVVDMYTCTCVAGFANGMCGYSDYITEFTAECTVATSTSTSATRRRA